MFRVSYRTLFHGLLVTALGLMASFAVAQDATPATSKDQPKDQAQQSAPAATAQPADAVDPMKRAPDAKRRKQQMREFRKEVNPTY